MSADKSLREDQPISLLKTASQKVLFGSAVFLVCFLAKSRDPFAGAEDILIFRCTLFS